VSKYPIGWYKFEESKKIKKGKLYTINRFGKAFVCFRSSDESVHIYDAYCPHLGAHLGVGGKIEKDKIVCPFHGWKYNTAGECVEIPYCKSIPKRAQLQSYPSVEAARGIYVYFSEDFRKPEESIPAFLQKPDLDFRQLDSLQIDWNKYEKLSEIAVNSKFPIQAKGPGLFISQESNSFKDFQMIISGTPLNDQVLDLTFSCSIDRNLNPFQKMKFKSTAKNQVEKILQHLL